MAERCRPAGGIRYIELRPAGCGPLACVADCSRLCGAATNGRALQRESRPPTRRMSGNSGDALDMAERGTPTVEVDDPLGTYRAKRDFRRTPEPGGAAIRGRRSSSAPQWTGRF